MANDFDNTALNSAVKELWDEKVEEGRYANAPIMNRVANKSGTAVKKGDIIHVTIDQTYTVGTVGADGTFTPQNYTLATNDISLANWEQIAIRVLDRAEAQSFWTPDSVFPNRAGRAWGSRYDSNLAGLHGSAAAGNNAGNAANPQQFDTVLATEAILILANINIPLEDLSWCLAPKAFYSGLLREQQLTSASDAGLPKNVLTTGYQFPLMGAPLYLSTNIVRTGGATPVYKNLLLHKSAMAIAWQKDGEFERARATGAGILADVFVSQSLYGYAVIRSDHFVVINSAG